MRVTQKTIAWELGISLITVSRALNNSGYVSDELKKRILDYAKKRSYVPDRASQVLVRNRVRNLAVFTPTNPDYFWDDIKKGVLSAAEYIKSFNYEVHYHRIPDYDTGKFIRVLKQEIKNGLDAAAFVNIWFYDMKAVINAVEKAGIPYLLYNVDAPETNRLCYIGSDYGSGGRLAANFIGKSLSVYPDSAVLVIGIIENRRCAIEPDINSARLQGFLAVMDEQYPTVRHQVEYIALKSKKSPDTQIREFLKKYEHRVNAVYFIPALNTTFLGALEQYDYGNTITVLHDTNDVTLRYLERGLLTAVVYQDPVLQGVTTVRTLEHILESKIKIKQRDVEIIHTLIFKENTGFLRNYILPEFED